MSQILVRRPDFANSLLLQDLYFSRKKTEPRSSVREAKCHACGQGIDDGVSVTAKKTGQKMMFFCQHHLFGQ